MAPWRTADDALVKFKRSLFRVTANDDLTLVEHLKTLEKSDDDTDKFGRSVRFFRVTAKLMTVEDVDDGVEDLMTKDCDKDRDNIHVWMNKLKYYQQKGVTGKDEVRLALEQVNRLKQNTDAYKRAEADYALWLAQIPRQQKMYEESVKIFARIAPTKIEDLNQTESLINCAYLKALVHFCTDEASWKKPPTWQIEQLDTIFRCILLLRRSAAMDPKTWEPQDWELCFWLQAAKVTTMYNFDKAVNEFEDRFKTLEEVKQKSVTEIEKAIQAKIRDYAKNYSESNPTFPKRLLASVGLQCWWYAAKEKDNPKQQKSWAEEAIKFGDLAEKKYPNQYLPQKVLAKGHLTWWALDYLQECKSEALSTWDQMRPPGAELTSRDLMDGVFFGRASNPAGSEGRSHLEKACQALQKLYDDYGPSTKRTASLARVKYLLGHDDSEVERLLKEAVGSKHPYGCRDVDRTGACTLLGLFYEAQSRSMYEKAVSYKTECQSNNVAQDHLKKISKTRAPRAQAARAPAGPPEFVLKTSNHFDALVEDNGDM